MDREMEEGCYVVEWKIENFSQWCAEVHGECIKSPGLYTSYYHDTIELYPKGISGLEEHLDVRFCGMRSYSGDLSFCSSNGTLLCPKKSFNGVKNLEVVPPGPKFEDVLSRIRQEGEDFIILRLRIQSSIHFDEQRMCTTINVSKISLKINPSWIEKMKSDDTKHVFFILSSPDDYIEGIHLKTWSENDAVHFKITPPRKFEYPVAAEMCVSLTGSDGTVDNRGKKEHVFRDNKTWTFPDSLQKKELVGKRVSLFLCLKTRNRIQNTSYVNWDCSDVSFTDENNPSTDPGTSNTDSVAVVTRDSGSRNFVTSDMPDDSVLSKDLMCLYQDQAFSDIILKCDNVSFPVHKAILSARSPVFKTMLSTDMTEASASNEVDIGDLDPSTLGLFLTYLYSGAVEDLQCDRALKLYYAATKYQVPSLKRECAKFLCSKVSMSNVCDILSLAHEHQDQDLTAASHNFIVDNFDAVLESLEWKSFAMSEPLLAVNTMAQFAVEGSVRKRSPQQGDHPAPKKPRWGLKLSP